MSVAATVVSNDAGQIVFDVDGKLFRQTFPCFITAKSREFLVETFTVGSLWLLDLPSPILEAVEPVASEKS